MYKQIWWFVGHWNPNNLKLNYKKNLKHYNKTIDKFEPMTSNSNNTQITPTEISIEKNILNKQVR